MKALLSSSPRYLAVSVTCMTLNIALLVALDRVGVHYGLAVIASALVLIPLSYALHLAITYRTQPGAGSFARYAAAQIVNTPVAILLFFLIRDCAGVAMVWAAPAVIGLMFLYNITSSFWAIALDGKLGGKLGGSLPRSIKRL
ncbi:GtrA family protein [Sphingomonas radiodurans]|uniref:GtrA family protein n=1 Tax=Sphingomonas radiodurans TaxID=2890321 RepID=UPI001E48FA8F|nr:GtrA family protein [Sphingomonas radiodurans]WBH15116.1 GtrA family protein [Sphingomonas radiodurans]